MLVLADIARLYDGSGSGPDALHTGVDLLLDGGRVHAVQPHDATRHGPGPVQRGEHRVVDCAGLTVTPGLVDGHGHITILGLRPHEMDRMNGPAGLLLIEKVLHATLVEGGVTTMRDIGGATQLMKRMVDEGVMLGPRLKIAIAMLSTTGGHADFRGPDRCHAELSRLWPEGPGRPSSIVDGPWEARKRVREIAACGADLIKLCTSPGVASPGDQLEHRDFSPEEIAAICDEAGHRGLRVAAHAHSRTGIAMAIDNGVSDIQHISFLDEELAERAHAKGCTVTPTSWVTAALRSAEGLSPFVMEKVKRVGEHHQRAVAFARGGGLKIVAGTDPVLPGMHGRNYLEIAALMDDGLSALEAWHAMTGQAASVIGQTDAGTLTPGQRADLLVCRDDVLEHPERLHPDRGDALVEVLKDGLGHRRGLDGIPQRDYRSTVTEALASDASV